jgi:chemotaxis protein CheD
LDKDTALLGTRTWGVSRKLPGVEGGTAQAGLREVYLHPGQSYVATSPVVLKMILGSCAGVFLFDPVFAIGGAAHFMLPRHGAGTASPRYGDVAIAGLLEEFRAWGGAHNRHKNVQAKIFGGASMFRALRDLQGIHIGHVGERNVETALDILKRAQIAVVEKDVLGDCGRKVSMVSHTGKTTIEFVRSTQGHR